MKRIVKKIAIVSFAVIACIGLAACSNKEAAEESGKEKIKIGCFPSTDQLPTILKDSLADKYDVELVMFEGNNMPCEALSAKEIDAVVGNGDKWLDNFNKENNTDLVMVDPYYSHFSGLYSDKYESIEEFPENAKIAIANDPMNTNNALKLLQNANMIKLSDTPSNGELYSKMDIVENSKNLEFIQMDLTMIAKNLGDVDGAVTSAILIKEAGRDPLKYLALPQKEDLQKVGLIVHADNKDKEWVKDAIEVSHTEENSEKLVKELDGTAFLLDKIDEFYAQHK